MVNVHLNRKLLRFSKIDGKHKGENKKKKQRKTQYKIETNRKRTEVFHISIRSEHMKLIFS